MSSGPRAAYQFYVTYDGYELATQGLVEEWGLTQRITPIGLLTHGFVVGDGDFWYYGETISDAGWTKVDL